MKHMDLVRDTCVTIYPRTERQDFFRSGQAVDVCFTFFLAVVTSSPASHGT